MANADHPHDTPVGAPAPSSPLQNTASDLVQPLLWVWPIAGFALVTTIWGRLVIPSFHGVMVGAEPWLHRADFAAGVLSQLLLFALAALLLSQASAVVRIRSLPHSYRIFATALAGAILGLCLSASGGPLPPVWSNLLSVAVVTISLLGAAQGMIPAHTRAASIMLGTTAFAAMTRQAAWLMTHYMGEHTSLALLGAARGTATAALALQALVGCLALMWVATRRRRLVSPWTTLCMAIALVLSWVADQGAVPWASPWKLVISRSVHRLLFSPEPLGSLALRSFAALLCLLFAAIALGYRRPLPALSGALALLLMAGIHTDIPLCALSLTVASLSVALVSHDRRAVWQTFAPSRPD